MSKSARNNRSLNKIAYAILNSYRGGRSSNDDPISIQQIKYHIINMRATLLRQDMNKNNELNYHAEQSLGCVEMELVDQVECCNFSSDCYILRSKQQIPETIRLKQKSGFTFIGTPEGKKRFPLETPTRAEKMSWRPFTGKSPRSFVLNNYVYVTNSLGIEIINVRGIFADPTKAKNFKTCEGDPCYTDDSEFPIPEDMITEIEDYIVKNKMSLLARTPQDTETDLQYDQAGRQVQRGE